MKIVWSRAALQDRRLIFDFIAAEDGAAAIDLDERLETCVAPHRDVPTRGRPGRVPGTREILVPRTSFLIAYAVHDRIVRILAVVHGARRWPDRVPID